MRRIQVLLVEDSPGDVRLTQEVFRERDDTVELHVAVDGVEAMAFLRNGGVYSNSPRPDFILHRASVMSKLGAKNVAQLIHRIEASRVMPCRLRYRANSSCRASERSAHQYGSRKI
jgi:CheY-like chemotaxis protein